MTAPDPTQNIRDIGLSDALGARYLAYALSTITSRSLPDVRDGLKPVHRRLRLQFQPLQFQPKPLVLLPIKYLKPKWLVLFVSSTVTGPALPGELMRDINTVAAYLSD